jgi:hypothetical protein
MPAIKKGNTNVKIKNNCLVEMQYIKLWHEHMNDGWQTTEWNSVKVGETTESWQVDYRFGWGSLGRDWWKVEMMSVDGTLYRNHTRGNVIKGERLVTKSEGELITAAGKVCHWRPKGHMLMPHDHMGEVLLTVSETQFTIQTNDGDQVGKQSPPLPHAYTYALTA